MVDESSAVLNADVQRRMPDPPRKVPWILHWYLLFRHPALHLFWVLFAVAMMYGVMTFPRAVKSMVPWEALQRHLVPTRGFIENVQAVDLYDRNNRATGEVRYTYRFAFLIGHNKHLRAATDEIATVPRYKVKDVVSVEYLRECPLIAHLQKTGPPWSGHEFFFGLALPALLLLIVGYGVHVNNALVRLLKYGRVARSTFEKVAVLNPDEKRARKRVFGVQFRFTAHDGTEHVAYGDGAARNDYSSSPSVLYNPRDPSDYLVIPKVWRERPFHIDHHGHTYIKPGQLGTVILLPSLYLGIICAGMLGLRDAALVALGTALILIFPFQSAEGVRRYRNRT